MSSQSYGSKQNRRLDTTFTEKTAFHHLRLCLDFLKLGRSFLMLPKFKVKLAAIGPLFFRRGSVKAGLAKVCRGRAKSPLAFGVTSSKSKEGALDEKLAL